MAPDIVVGIDLGYTHTGVAYSLVRSDQTSEPGVISSWPGRKNTIVHKVPTRLYYVPNHEGPKFWGFQRPKPPHERKAVVEEYFKLSLDPSLLPEEPDQGREVHGDLEDRDGGDDDDEDNTDDGDEGDEESRGGRQDREMKRVKGLFRDFLRAVRIWIEPKLEKVCPGTPLASIAIDYVFSVPTTWPEEVVSSYQEIIEEAGYTSAPDHKAIIGLTEADAAAVYTSIRHTMEGAEESTRFSRGDVLLVCDAGGGTTDVSILKVSSFQNNTPQLDQLHSVEGSAAGSVKIDEAFEQLVRSRLERIDGLSPENLDHILLKATKDFREIKHNFGKPQINLLPKISIAIPSLDLPRGCSEAEKAALENGKMVFDLSEIEHLFDEQVNPILDLIGWQLDYLRKDYPEDRVKYLVLSGGLGSSAYVSRKVGEYLSQNDYSRAVKLLISNDPQLVVCRGLVLNRLHEYLNISVISGLRSREAYGITYDEPRSRNLLTKPWRVKHKIKWVLEQNEFVGRNATLKASFTRAVRLNRSKQPVRHNVVKFTGLDAPPDRVDLKQMKRVCSVDFDLRQAFPTEVRHGISKFLHRRLQEVSYEICLRPGPADLQIEVFIAGEKCASGGVEFKVNWKSDVMILREVRNTESSEDDGDAD